MGVPKTGDTDFSMDILLTGLMIIHFESHLQIDYCFIIMLGNTLNKINTKNEPIMI